MSFRVWDIASAVLQSSNVLCVLIFTTVFWIVLEPMPIPEFIDFSKRVPEYNEIIIMFNYLDGCHNFAVVYNT